MKKSLYAALAQYGPILDIIIKKNVKMRGQAFVVFKDLTGAVTAQKEMDGFTFFDKSMVGSSYLVLLLFSTP